MQTACVIGQSIRSCVAEGRRLLGVNRNETPETFRDGGDDGLYRVELKGGYVVECTVKRSAVSSGYVL